MNRLLIYHALMYGICGYALFRGRADARMVAAIFLVGEFRDLWAKDAIWRRIFVP